MSEVANIQIRVDASQGLSGLNALRQAVRATSQELRALGSSNGFDQLSRQVTQTSGAFATLAKSLAAVSASASRIASISGSSFGGLSREAKGATSALGELGRAFSISSQAAEILGATVGAISLASLAKSAQSAGNSLTTFRISIDAVAASSRESSDALKFIREMASSVGAPLDAATESFRGLYTSMRALGRNPDEIFKVFRGFSTALTALHVSAADQKMAWREIAETYSQGVIHTRQAILSLGSHIPAMAANLQQALGVNGEKLHAMFKAGGLPIDTWTKVADILEKRYGSQLPEAFRHTTANIVALQNAMTQMQQTIYESGFDSGLTTFLKSLQGGLNTIGVDNIGRAIGEAFRGAFTALALLTEKVIAARGPIMEVGQALATYALATTGIRLVAGAFSLLLSPLGALATLTALASSEWLNLSGVFSGSDAAFNSGAERIKKLTNGFIDLHKAMKGAVELWELAKGLFDGKSLTESKALAAQAGAAFDAGSYGAQKGQDFAKSFTERAATLFGKLGEALKVALPSFDAKSLKDDWDRLYQASTPTPFHGAGDYAANAARYGKPDLSLSEELKKVWERLVPANKALLEYKETLEEIAKMKGKLDPLSGKLIGDAELQRLKDAARETALHDAYPAVAKIGELMDRVRLEREALANVGGNSSSEALKQEREFLQIKYDLLKKHVQLRADEEQALRGLIAAEHELAKGGDKDPFTRWANAQKSAQDSLNDSISSGMDSLADGLARAVTSGRDLRSTLQGMLREISANFLRAGLRSLMAEGLKSANLGGLFNLGGKDSIASALAAGQGVLDRANSSLDKIGEEALKHVVTPTMDVQAAVVNITGGFSGLTAFKPGASIQDAIRPQGVGGITPNNSTAPLFSGNTLQEFKANVRTGGLTPIPSNSASLFGQGLGARQSLSDVGGALKAIPEFKLSSADSVKAFGAGLTKLAPVAERIGVTPISGSLAELYKRAGLDKLTEKNLRTVHPELQEAVLKAKMTTGANIMINDGMGIRTPAQAAANAAAGRGILHSKHLTGDAVDVLLKDGSGRLIADGSNPAYARFNDAMQAASGGRIRWGGTFSHKKDWDHWERIGGGGKSAGLGDKLSDQSAKVAESLKKQIHETTRLATESQKSFTALAQATPSLSSFDGGVSKLADTMAQGVPAADGFGDGIAKLIQQLLSGLGGAGGGLGGAISGVLGGLFSEGGYSNSPVSSMALPASFWTGAPHFSEGGTTLPGGGIPAVLHQNEAVIPLSRGREIPVRLEGDGVGGGGQTVINNNFATNITAKDHDSFRRSHSQVLESMHKQAARARVRNG